MNSIVPLCKKYDPKRHDPTGWWCSIKYDGVRGLYTPEYSPDGAHIGYTFLTRTGKNIYLPVNCTLHLSPIPLDVELTIPGKPFRYVSGVARRHEPRQEVWKDMVFRVIDAPVERLKRQPFYKRLLLLRSTFKELHSTLDKGIGFAAPIEHTEITSREHYDKVHAEIMAAGHEGTVLRHPDATWEPKRLGTWLKRTGRESAEAIVVGVQGGEGKHSGAMGALLCQWVEPPVIKGTAMPTTFKIGSGFTDAERAKSSAFWVGKTVTVSFKAINKTGAPREPTYKGIRDE